MNIYKHKCDWCHEVTAHYRVTFYPESQQEPDTRELCQLCAQNAYRLNCDIQTCKAIPAFIEERREP